MNLEYYNPEGSLLRRQQLRMLEILEAIDRICAENDLKYWLSSGTLLGAVRHGGFIPWDDDLDIEMPYKDYKRFVKIAEAALPSGFFLQTHKTDPYFLGTFAKVRDGNSMVYEHNRLDQNYLFRGIFVDIFPVEHSSKIASEFIGRLHRAVVLSNQYKKYDIKSARGIYSTVLYYLMAGVLYNIIRHIYALLPGKVLRLALGMCFFTPRKKENIFPLKKIEFEKKLFYAPGNHDAYLKDLFGDYMTIPDEEDRKSHMINDVTFL